VRQAVQAVLTELVSNPAVLETLRGTLAPATSPRAETAPAEAGPPSTAGWLPRAWKGALSKVRRSGAALAALASKLRLLLHFKVELLTALGAGTLAGMAGYYTGPWLSAAMSGLGAGAATLAVHAALWLRRALKPLAARGAPASP
jgi:hypothetical protein